MRNSWWKYLLFAVWLFFLGWLIRNEYGAAEQIRTADLELFNERSATEKNTAWYTIFLGDRKIGWNMHITTPGERGISIYDRTVLRVPVAGKQHRIDYEQSVSTDSSFLLREFILQISSSVMETRIQGRAQEGGIRLSITSGGSTQEQFIPVSDEIRLPVTLVKMLDTEQLTPGDEIRFPVFDPTTLSTGYAVLKSGDWETISVGGSQIEALRVTSTFQNLTSEMWLNRAGEVVKEQSLMNMTMIRSSADAAQRMDRDQQPADLYQYFAIIPDHPLKNPRKLSRLKVTLRHYDLPTETLSNHRQIVSPGKDGPVVQITTRGRDAEAAPSPQHTEATPLIQCSDPRIVRVSERLVIAVRSDSAKVQTLVQWVYSAINKQPSVGLPSATEVLRERSGDCNEHTVLFVALARAAGIPAKMRAGVVYLDNGFYYHAWAAAWVDGHWIDVDPTFGQYQPDATHIALTEGELFDLMTIGRIMGRLEISIWE